MPVVSFIAVYVLIWSLVLQAVLPFGVKSQSESGGVTEGTDPGAPVRPLWLRKILATTLIALVLWGVFFWIATSTGLGMR
jgi:predicted secreted protein